MKQHNKIFIIFAMILLIIMSTKLYKDYHANEELKIMIIQNEVDSLSSFISAFRQTYQKAFIDNKIPVNDKTVHLLPVKTIKSMGDMFARTLGDRTTVRTVSNRPRNIENQANAKELKVIKYFNENKDEKSYFKVLDHDTYYYVKPLYITNHCLKCHGKKEDAPLTIAQRYDKSYNYKLGELRGITTITISKKDIVNKLHISYMRNIKIATVVYILFLLAIYLMIRIIIKNQEQYTKNLEEKVIKRTQELRQEKEHIQTVIESNNNAIIAIDWSGKITTFNQKAEDMFGWTKEEMIGSRNLLRIIPPKYKQRHTEALANYFKTGILSGKLDNAHQAEGINKNGDIFPIRISIGSKFKSKNTIVIANISDISQEKNQEELIHQQSKMVAMGEMIGNIAHQWRQPLSVISTASTGMLLQKEYGTLTDESFNQTCEAINQNAQYLSNTIDDFSNFIKGDRQLETFNLKKNINSLLHLIEGSAKANNIALILDLKEDINIKGYPNELSQCFINIFNNSKDVLKEMDSDRFVFITTYINNNNVVIKFKDNAGGIKEEIIPKIFDPYFTTKHKSKGTGLGLHMTYNLITDGMKGSIEASNVSFDYDGKHYYGAQFLIYLPIG
ncbi:MAG: DUF3365 domain-containing protein [Arcobacteraceae bacterium]|nr:DUF3365 domain-containing protein [Arcobacteraceae bacterium]